MRYSILIPTFNRAGDLALTLRSLLRLETGCADGFEVLVIDNNCTDDTATEVERYIPRFDGRLRRIREERQGLNAARNRGVAEARYEIAAFLDDDVEVDPQWLVAVQNAHTVEGAAVVGGRAYLIYPGTRPAWLGERDEGYLSKVELGRQRRTAAPDELYGLNLSIEKRWIERVGGFRDGLDRSGSSLLSGGETELLERISAAGGRLVYEPDAVVGHRVPRSRLRRRWFWSRSYWGCRGGAWLLPEQRISAYELTRASWHMALAGWSAAGAALSKGLHSEACFHETRVIASQAGMWIGMAERLWR